MSGFSWDNPFPMVLDDEPTEIELAYTELRAAAGERAGDPSQSALSPSDTDPLVLSSLADLETKCSAIAIGCAATDVEHALWESFPNTMEDQLAGWEKILAIVPIADTVAARQRAVTAAVTRLPDATNPGLARALFAVSPKLALDSLPYGLWSVSMLGKWLGPLPGVVGVPPFTTGAAAAIFGNSADLPSYADSFVVRIRYALALGELQPDAKVLADADALLVETLPAWHVWAVYTLASGPQGEGFHFDGGPNNDSFFDVTAFGLE